MPYNVTVYTLSNGLTVAFVHLPGARAAHLTFALQAGPRFERPEHNGVTHLFERALFLGCSTHPAPSAQGAAFEVLGERPDTGTDLGAFTIDLTVARAALPEAICLLGRTVTTPAFKFVDRIIAAGAKEVAEDFDNFEPEVPTSSATVLYQKVFGAHPMGQPIYGTPATLGEMTPDRLKEAHAAMFTGSNAVLTIAGDLDGAGGASADDLLVMVGACFDLPAGERRVVPPFVPPPRARPSLTFMGDEDEQTMLTVGFLAPTWRDRLGPASRLLVALLADGVLCRMATQVRESGLCSDHLGEFGGSEQEPLATFLLVCDTAKVGAVTRAFLTMLARVVTDGVYPDELARTKLRAVREVELDLDHPRTHALHYGLDMFEAPAANLTPEAQMARVDAVTAIDVQAAARMMFAPENMTMVVEGASERARHQIMEAVALFAKPRVTS